MYAKSFSLAHSLKMRLALSLSIAGAVVAFAIFVLVSARGGSGGVPPGAEAANTGVWHLQREILLVGFGTAAVFAGLGWLLAGRIAGPLMAIAEAARRIEQGDRDAVIPLSEGNDEL